MNGTASPGDAPGFPVTISEAGSYRLSGNLTVANGNTTAIEITADDVTLDLNGFAILGPTVCTPSCRPIGAGDGVFAANGVDSVTVVNGTIRGMGNAGVQLLGASNRVERVNPRSNASQGIEAGVSATVTGNKATANGGAGIVTGAGSVVTGNTASGNGSGDTCMLTHTLGTAPRDIAL